MTFPSAEAKAKNLDKVWQTGLFCQSVFPERALDNFFVIDELKSRMLVASFNDDRVSFNKSPISLSRTPDELVNRKLGLTLNRKTLQMKWQNQKSQCQIKTVDELNVLAQEHLSFLLGDNKI
jgi:hypothetical protein